MFSSLPLLTSLDFFKFQLPQALVDLVLLGTLPLNSQSILFFASELDFLEVLQSCGQLAKIAAKLAVLMRQLIDFFSQKVHLVDSCTVTVVEVK